MAHASKSPEPSNSKKTRNRGACTNCKQGKIKCDAKIRFPHPCTRCGESVPPLHCHIDPTYKRKPVTRSRAERNIGPSALDNATSPEESLPFTDPPNITTPSIRDLNSTDKCIGQVYISGPQVASYFVKFFNSYHPHMPLFHEHLDPDGIFMESPFLFWTVCSIAARPTGKATDTSSEQDRETYLQLVQEVRKMASELILHAHRSVRVVQALLLLCEFPFLTVRLREDAFCTYGALAVRLATQLGLHRPHHTQDFTSREKYTPLQIQERTRAWLYCFIVDVSFSIARGIPPIVREDWVIVYTSRQTSSNAISHDLEYTTRVELPKILRFTRLMSQVNNTLGCSPSTPTGLADASSRSAFLLAFDYELRELETSLSPMAPLTQLYFHMAVLHVHIYGIFVDEPSHNDSNRDLLASTKAVLECFSSASAIVRISGQINEAGGMTYYPSSVRHYVIAASFCLLKVYASPVITETQRSSALSFVAQAHSIIKSFTATPNDLSDRGANLLELLVNAARQRPLDQLTTKLYVNSRMGVGNIFFDAVYRARLYREQNSDSDTLSSTPGTSSHSLEIHSPSVPSTSSLTGTGMGMFNSWESVQADCQSLFVDSAYPTLDFSVFDCLTFAMFQDPTQPIQF